MCNTNKNLTEKILVLGMGNTLRKDDGIGEEIVKILNQTNNPKFTSMYGGTDSLAFLDKIAQYTQVIIIDCANMQETPGTVKRFSLNEAKLKIKNDTLSTHGFGLAQLFGLIERLEINTKITVIGVQPKDLGFGEGLSKEIQNKIPYILELINKGGL